MKVFDTKYWKADILILMAAFSLLAITIGLELPVDIMAGIYMVIIGILTLIVFPRMERWWIPLTLGLVILLPGPLDRLLLSVSLTPERTANPYPVFSVIDMLMLVGILIEIKNRKAAKKQYRFHINYLTSTLALITIIGIVSSVVAYYNSPTFYWPMAFRAVFYSVRFLLVYFWVSLLFKDLTLIKRFPVAIFLISMGFVLLVLLSPSQNYEGGNRLSVATYGVNTFGHLLAFVSLLCLPFIRYFRESGHRIMRLLTISALGICLLFLLMSGNRMSFVLVLVGMLSFYFFLPGSAKRKLKLAILALGAVVLALVLLAVVKPEIYNRITGVFQLVSGENAFDDIKELQARFVVWNISYEMILQHPLLGIGPGQWNYMKGQFGPMPPWMSTILDPHNGYLLYAAEMGLLCLTIYYSIIITAVHRGWKSFKEIKVQYTETPSGTIYLYMSFLLILCIVIVCWLIADLTNASGLNIRVQSLMWSLCAILFISPALVKKKYEKGK